MSKSALCLLIHYALFSLLLATVIRGRSRFLEKEMCDELQPTNTEFDETESDLHEIDILGCQDILDDCSSLKPKDCYHDYYALRCCQTCRLFIQNLLDTNCLYGDKIVGSEIVGNVGKKVCRNFSKFLEKEKDDELQPTNTEVDETESYWPEINILGCQDILDDCSSLKPKDCYHAYYALACCQTCRLFIQNLLDTNCLYGDRIAGCSEMVGNVGKQVCHNSSNLCCKTCSKYVSLNKATSTVATPVQKVNSNKKRNSRFRKRSAEKEEKAENRLMTIEVFTVMDYSIFEKFFAESNAASDAEKRKGARIFIYYFFTHIMEDVKKMYESIKSERFKFTIKWVGAFIAETPEDLPIFEPGKPPNADYALESLRNWIDYQRANKDGQIKIPNYDMLVAFTRHHMEDAVGGKAMTFGGVCGHRNNAIVRYNMFSTLAIATAHEIGHLLGVSHVNLCFGEERWQSEYYPKPSKYSRYFSSCSESILKANIDTLDEDDENCLTDGGGLSKHREKEIFLNLHLGQIYDLDEQCKIEFGPESFYIGGPENDHLVCQKISCLNGNHTFKAMDGTPCSNGAWCLEGECVLDSRAPKVSYFCGQRNYQGNLEVLTVWGDRWLANCTQLVDHDPSLCYDSIVWKYCCASCRKVKLVKDYCKHDTQKALTHQHKKFTCSQLVAYNPRLCEKAIQKDCCKSCRFTVRPPKSE